MTPNAIVASPKMIAIIGTNKSGCRLILKNMKIKFDANNMNAITLATIIPIPTLIKLLKAII